MSLRTLFFPTVATLGCAIAGCASQGPKPNDELTKAHTVVEQADKGNAQRYAAADIQRAHDELSAAERAAAQKNYAEARTFARRAEVDADLAVARGNSAEAQKAAQEVAQSNSTLQHEAQRNETGNNPQ